MEHSIAVAGAAFALLLAGAGRAQLDKGSSAPAFEFAKVWNGGPADFKGLAGKLVILDFAQTW
jgi:hypothetical protein